MAELQLRKMASADIMAKLMKEAEKEWSWMGVGYVGGMRLRSGRVVGVINISRESLEDRVAHISSILNRLDLMAKGPKGDFVFEYNEDKQRFSRLLGCLLNFLRNYCQDILAQLPRLTNLLLDTVYMMMVNLGEIRRGSFMSEIRGGSFLGDSCAKFTRMEKRLEKRCDYV